MKAVAAMRGNEDEIVVGCQRSELWAQKALFEDHRDRVYSTAFNFFNCPSTAMDVTQDVFLKVFKKIAGFRGDSALSTWICRITINTCLNEKRRRKRLIPLDIEKLPWGRRRERPDAQFESYESAALVRQAIQTLSPELRIILVLRYVEELSYSEISAILDCTMGTVASRLNRAHSKLGDHLTKLRGEES